MGFLKNVFVFISIGCGCVLNSELIPYTSYELENDESNPRLMYQKQNSLEKLKLRLLEKMEVKCKDKVPIETLEETFSSASSCIGNHVNTDNYLNEVSEAARMKNLLTYLKENCYLWTNILQCINPAVATVKDCFNYDENTAIEKIFKISSMTNKFMCENNGTRMQKFFDEGGYDCVKYIKTDVMKCSLQFTQTSDIKKVKSIIYFDDTYCKSFKTLQTCIKSKLTLCPSKTIFQLFEDYMAKVTAITCSKASVNTFSNIENIVLLLSIYLIFKIAS